MYISSLTIPQIAHLVQNFFNTHHTVSAKQRGRPKKYSDAFIMTLLVYQEAHSLSVREVLQEASRFFNDVPVPSNYLYRRARIRPEFMEAFIEWSSSLIFQGGEYSLESMYIDGTGFKYDDLYPMKYERGTRIRKIKSHVRAVVVVADFGKVGRRRLKGIVAIRTGPAYASEVKLAEEIYSDWAQVGPPGNVLVGDALYAVKRHILELEAMGVEAHFRVREDTFRSRIRDEVLLRMRQRVKSGRYYRRRSNIESVFSEIKQKMTSTLRTRDENSALVMMLARFAAWNICMVLYAQKHSDGGILFFVFVFQLS